MEDRIFAIIKKIRRIFNFGKYAEIVNQPPEIIITENDGNFYLVSISFTNYDSIYFSPEEGITFYPEHGLPEQLIKCSNIDDFLNI